MGGGSVLFVLFGEFLDEVDDVDWLVERVIVEEELDFVDVGAFFFAFFHVVEVAGDFDETVGDVAVDFENQVLVSGALFVEAFHFF